jgi:mono/diheme cytochrome c family protein
MRFVYGLLTLAMACTSGGGDGGGDPDGGGRPDGNPAAATIFPPVIHTGHDGGAHSFRVPVSTDLSNQVEGEATWSSDDPSIASIASVDTPAGYPATRGVWAMLTAAGSGQTSVSATIGGHSVSAEVLVATYSAEQVSAGDTRYHTEGTEDRQACASCHQADDGVDHTPTEMAFHDDAALLVVITQGHYPDQCLTDEGDPCTCGGEGCTLVPGYQLSVDHTWNLTEGEAAGIVPYLRSLPPRGF